MNSIRKKFKAVCILRVAGEAYLLFLSILGIAACSTFTTYLMESKPPEHQIMIDGKTDDWRDALAVMDEKGLLVGFLNDQENLYVCLVAEDNSLRAQIQVQGLTVWFDPQGGKEKAFGIKFPLGMPPREMPMPPGLNKQGEMDEDLPMAALNELEIIRSKKVEPERMEISQAKGIEVKVIPSSGLLVYELKIPLLPTQQHPLAVGTQPGKTIGIGFETGKDGLSRTHRGGPEGMPGGDRPPMEPPMGGGPGQGGMGGFDRGSGMPKPLKIWAIVQLASDNKTGMSELL